MLSALFLTKLPLETRGFCKHIHAVCSYQSTGTRPATEEVDKPSAVGTLTLESKIKEDERKVLCLRHELEQYAEIRGDFLT